MLKYPIPKEKRIRLAKVYYHICTTPGMPTHIVSTCADNLQTLTRSKRKLSVEDMRLPWKPIYTILAKDLFLTRRQYEIRYAYIYTRTKATEHAHAQTQPNVMVHGLYR